MLEGSSKVSFNKLFFNLTALADMGIEVTSSKDFDGIIKSSLYLIMGTLSVARGVIFQFDPNKGELNIAASKGLKETKNIALPVDGELLHEIIKINKAIQRDKAKGPMKRFFARERKHLDSIMAYILLPLIVKGELVGMIALDKKFSGKAYTKDDYEILYMMAHHTAVSLHNHHLLIKLAHQVDENKRLYEDLRLIYHDTIQAFSAAIDAKDDYTKGHSSRVSKYCVTIAKEMGFPEEELEGIEIAGFLHDIGKIVIDKGIINKPSRLTKDERVEINQHPLVSYEILSKVKFPWKNIPLNVRYHHEKIDGTGYPDKLKGTEIPIGAKIMALADAFDAMTTDRPYRKKLTLEKAIKEVEMSLGRQFDPEIVRCLFNIIKSELTGGEKKFGIVSSLKTSLDIKTVNNLLGNVTV
ncbi:MAG: HD-GYP domain-containing protein [Thermodesulfobacteriota bacterium]